MPRLTRVHEASLSADDRARALALPLTHAERVKSRLVVMQPEGAIAIVLPERRRAALRDGTVLAGDDGTLAVIVAAPEPLARVTAQPPLLMRAVYHLANRHVPVQLASDHLLIERDPVLERMLAALGAGIEHVELPFDPEPGAYEGHSHGHGAHVDDDPASATVGEQLSIAAHARAGR
jgi:urease accessory protein